jgi:hypothetical protein
MQSNCCTAQMRRHTKLKEKLNETIKLWSKPFHEYYNSDVKAHIDTKLERVALERLNCYNSASGITQNSSEGFNIVLKRLLEWKEAELDMMLLTLYHMQRFYVNNIRLEKAGRGDHH